MTARDLSAPSDDALLAGIRGMFDATDPVPDGLADRAKSALLAVATTDRPPSGCGWCGLARHGHYRQYTEPVGWHAYTAPSQAQIKARMLKRRRHALKLREASR